MYQIRRIKPDSIPTILDSETDEERPRTETELLQLGIVSLGYDDLYDVAHMDGTPEPPWGRKISEGFDRYQQISGAKKDNVLRARVVRDGEEQDIPRSALREDDHVKYDRIIPRFAGEP
jgi:hypothetical protein